MNQQPMPLKPPDLTGPDFASEPIAPYPRRGSGASPQEIAVWCRAVPEWSVVERQEIHQLERVFHVPDFRAALAFSQQVGELAERSAHHPAIRVEWGRVTVTWWTLRTRGLHRNDVIMAARTDGLWEGWVWEGEPSPLVDPLPAGSRGEA